MSCRGLRRALKEKHQKVANCFTNLADAHEISYMYVHHASFLIFAEDVDMQVGDLAEFNACTAVLRGLYKEGVRSMRWLAG